jgi:hypothetical protein
MTAGQQGPGETNSKVVKALLISAFVLLLVADGVQILFNQKR